MINPILKIAKKILLHSYFSPIGTIFMLHRCSPINSKNLYWNEHMKVSPGYLRKSLNELMKTHDFISLDDLYVLSQTKSLPKKPFIIMTFDDGYLDNYEYALPIFDELHIPFTVYITNSFPDRTAFLWWYVLEDIIQNNKNIVLSDGNQFNCGTKQEKEDTFLSCRQLILAFDQEKLMEKFKLLFNNYYIYDYTSYNDNLCLSWEMIQEMSNNRYCTIAAHTVNHKALNRLSDVRLNYEILTGKKELEERIGKPVKHFSYPFGTPNEIGSHEVEFIKTCGFDTVCYSYGGDINKKNIKKTHELPRIFFGELKR
jgi:peptidoglycan/xylan/chitin deacetylase (PgdA/CDA1 family)